MVDRAEALDDRVLDRSQFTEAQWAFVELAVFQPLPAERTDQTLDAVQSGFPIARVALSTQSQSMRIAASPRLGTGVPELEFLDRVLESVLRRLAAGGMEEVLDESGAVVTLDEMLRYSWKSTPVQLHPILHVSVMISRLIAGLLSMLVRPTCLVLDEVLGLVDLADVVVQGTYVHQQAVRSIMSAAASAMFAICEWL